jgi:hypothetical protein
MQLLKILQSAILLFVTTIIPSIGLSIERPIILNTLNKTSTLNQELLKKTNQFLNTKFSHKHIKFSGNGLVNHQTYQLIVGKKELDKISEKAALNIISYITKLECEEYISSHPLINNIICIQFEQPLKHYINLSKSIYPERKDIITLLSETHITTKGKGLYCYLDEIKFIYVNEKGALNLKKLRRVLGQDSVFIMLPLPGLYNQNNIQEILINSYHKKTPVIAFSTSLTRAGASISLHSSTEQIAKQIANIIHEHYTLKDTFKDKKILEPDNFEISTNERVIKSIGSIPPDKKDIVRIKELIR